jgi:hypothetical protein
MLALVMALEVIAFHSKLSTNRIILLHLKSQPKSSYKQKIVARPPNNLAFSSNNKSLIASQLRAPARIFTSFPQVFQSKFLGWTQTQAQPTNDGLPA